MPNEKKDYAEVVALKEDSQLKIDLNRGVASLQNAPENWFRPHICLNDFDGVEVIRRIRNDPEKADTIFLISGNVDLSGDEMWLNISFTVFLEKYSFKSAVRLSPRQTSYIIMNLPEESKNAVSEKIKMWYQESFLKNISKALERITNQFDAGDLFLKDTDRNKIFDIHGDKGGHDSVPYTEWKIVGGELFGKFFFGHTVFQSELNSLKRIDDILIAMRMDRDSTLVLIENAFRATRVL